MYDAACVRPRWCAKGEKIRYLSSYPPPAIWAKRERLLVGCWPQVGMKSAASRSWIASPAREIAGDAIQERDAALFIPTCGQQPTNSLSLFAQIAGGGYDER